MKKDLLVSQLALSYRLDTQTLESIICHTLNINSKELFLLLDISDDYLDTLHTSAKRVSHGYPLAYLLQSQEFFGLDLYVNDEVLIPRIDTELLVEKAIQEIQSNKEKVYYFDIGTGSGCIPVGVLSQAREKIEQSFFFEISDGAMQVAQKNIEKYFPGEDVRFFREDFHLMPQRIPGLGMNTVKNIVMTANLPYIKVHDIFLDKAVLDHEPSVALFGGRGTGFELYDDFFEILLELKKKNIFGNICVLIEIGYDQFEVSKDFLSKKSLNFEYFRDTGYHDRVIKIKL